MGGSDLNEKVGQFYLTINICEGIDGRGNISHISFKNLIQMNILV